MQTLRQEFNQRLLVCTVEDFPNPKLLLWNAQGVNQAAHKDEEWSQYLIPLSTSSGFFTKNFWDVIYSKYSLPALKIPRTLKQTRTYAKVPQKLKLCKLEFSNKETKADLQTLRDTIRDREALWKNLRPW